MVAVSKSKLAVEYAELQKNYESMCRQQAFTRNEIDRLKAVSRSMITRIITYLTKPTPENLYAVHQIMRNVEELTGDVSWRA